MTHFFRTIGRATGYVIRSHAFDQAITSAAGYIITEIRLADLIAKRSLLRRKHTNHLTLLGKTAFRLFENDIKPFDNNHITKIVRVIDEIKQEINIVDEELQRRREREKSKRKKQSEKQKPES